MPIAFYGSQKNEYICTMKKSLFFFVFCCALLCGGYAQQTKSESFEYRSPYVDLRPVKCTKQYQFDADNRLQGAVQIKGSDMVRGSEGYNEQHYEEVLHYQHGVLQGAFSQSFSHVGKGNAVGSYKVQRRWDAKGQFDQGHPHGKWTFTLSSNMNSGSESATTSYSYTLLFEHGRLQSLQDEKGRRLQFHDDGTISGDATITETAMVTYSNYPNYTTFSSYPTYSTTPSVHISHSLIADRYMDKDGELLPMTHRLRELSMATPFVLADSGYAVDFQEMRVVQVSRCADILNRYVRLTALDTTLEVLPHLSMIGRLREVQPVSADAAFDYYVQTPRSGDRLLQKGFYERKKHKYFLDSKAERRIRKHLEAYQYDLLSHKLNFMVRLTKSQSWKTICDECREGHSPILDMVAAKWSKADFDQQCKESAELLDKAFGGLYPLCGFRILSAHYEPYKGLKADVEMHVLQGDSVSYKSVVVPIATNSDGYILLGRLNPESYKVVPNLWDTVAIFERELNARSKELQSKLAFSTEWSREYRDFFDSVYADKTTKPEVRMEDLQYLESMQQELLGKLDQLRATYKEYKEKQQATTKSRKSRKQEALPSLFDN